MLRKQTLALALASTLLLSLAAAPVLAAPPEEAPASSEIVSTVLSWLSQVVGVVAGVDSGDALNKLGGVIDPGGLENPADPGHPSDDPDLTSSEEDPPTSEGGIVIDPGG